MISVIMYGRNDSYGYNLHKRAALSFNCIAEILTDPDDEILFVDYNTPDDFPTFPEAIRDTLTQKALNLTRIFRVRQRQHDRFRHRTHLMALEPIARNVAVRRSNPRNRWVLSTNTDMIFVCQNKAPLSELIRPLPQRFYHAPRIEIPETLWESLPRQRPDEVIATIRNWGRSLHLDEIVRVSERILYDAPGDFQLVLREDLFTIGGFNEEMLLGWHLDSNLAIRLQLLHGELGDLGDKVFGYHCDHTRQVTPAHAHARVQNSISNFVDNVTRFDVPSVGQSWGLLSEDIEEIRLGSDSARGYVAAIEAAVGAPLGTPYIARYSGETYDKVSYDPRHVLPFLVDLFSSAPRSSCLAWFGRTRRMIEIFSSSWLRLGFREPILVVNNPEFDDAFADIPGTLRVELDQCVRSASAFVFEFGLLDQNEHETERDAHKRDSEIIRAFFKVITTEQDRRANGQPLRTIAGINAIHNRFESLFRSFVGASVTPFGTRLRHGYVLPEEVGAVEWLPQLSEGSAGRRVDGAIESDPAQAECVAYGPYRSLMPGHYRFTTIVEVFEGNSLPASPDAAAFAEAVVGNERLGATSITLEGPGRHAYSFDFNVNDDIPAQRDKGVETRFHALTPCAFRILSATIERLGAPLPEQATAYVVAPSWLPFLQIGPAGRRSTGAVSSRDAESGHVVSGPYWPLRPGSYVLEVDIAFEDIQLDQDPNIVLASIEVMANNCTLGLRTIPRDHAARGTHSVDFSIPEADEMRSRTEIRVWTSGLAGMRLTRVSILRCPPAAVHSTPKYDWMPAMRLGPAARDSKHGLEMIAGVDDVAVWGPYWELPPGDYCLRMTLANVVGPRGEKLFGLELLANGQPLNSIDIYKPFGETNEIIANFTVIGEGSSSIEARLRSTGLAQGLLTSLTCEAMA